MAIDSNSGRIAEGTRLWEASAERKARSNISRYLAWLNDTRRLEFSSYGDLWRWSVTEIEDFWAS